MAKILSEIFVAQRSSSTIGDKPASQTAPGMSTAQSRLDSVQVRKWWRRRQHRAKRGRSCCQRQHRDERGFPRCNRIAAAFENFDRKDRDLDDDDELAFWLNR